MAGTMSGLDMMQSLMARGYSAPQAAALVGHMTQESGLDPNAVNEKEGAHGLLQFRGSRWQGLQDYAKAQGKSPNDPGIQIDYIRQEMSGPEAKSARGFLAAGDVNAASAALKPYIRFGDNSDKTRLNNSVGLLAQYNAAQPQNVSPVAPVGALASGPQDPTSPINPTSTDSNASMSLAAAPVGPTLAQKLQSIGGNIANNAPKEQAPDFLPFQQMAPMQSNVGQSNQIAQALAKSYWG